MKNIFGIIFKRWGTINRVEYLVANILIFVITLALILLFMPLLWVLFVGDNIFIIASIIALPSLIFYTYTWLNITWKRGRDFLKWEWWMNVFSVVIIITTWFPVLFLVSAEFSINIIFHPVIWGIWVVMNFAWFILWLIFLFAKWKPNKEVRKKKEDIKAVAEL